MSGTDNVDLPELSNAAGAQAASLLNSDTSGEVAAKHTAQDLEAVFDVPVTVSAILEKAPWK